MKVRHTWTMISSELYFEDSSEQGERNQITWRMRQMMKSSLFNLQIYWGRGLISNITKEKRKPRVKNKIKTWIQTNRKDKNYKKRGSNGGKINMHNTRLFNAPRIKTMTKQLNQPKSEHFEVKYGEIKHLKSPSKPNNTILILLHNIPGCRCTKTITGSSEVGNSSKITQ